MLVNQILIILLLKFWYGANAARILGIFTMPSPSHYIMGRSLMQGLAEAGHDVTIISSYEEKNMSMSNYEQILLSGSVEKYKGLLKVMNLLETNNQSLPESIWQYMRTWSQITEGLFENNNVRNFLNSNKKFDVVIVEQFLNDAVKIFGHIYNAPVIAVSTVGTTPWVDHMMGNPSPLSYVPQKGTDFSPYMSFTERCINVLVYLFSHLIEYLYYFPQQNRILKKHFSNPPDIYDLYHNVSLVLLNSHESFNQPVPLVPNMVQIGGYHVKPPKKLPKDLQEYLDNATEGVVYFSLGSNLKSKDLPPEKKDAFLKAFGKLKQKILWKWEEDDLPGKPSNVKTVEWLPQKDILAHPNVKLFITHSGLLSVIEAVYHGVPVLAIPVLRDQQVTATLATLSRFALSLPYRDPTFSEEKLSLLLQKLLNDPKYRENVKKRSQLFHDRPMKPMETAVYWVEYVIRNRGAPHLRVAGADLPWYKYHCLDAIAFLTITMTACILIFAFIFTSYFRSHLESWISFNKYNFKTKQH